MSNQPRWTVEVPGNADIALGPGLQSAGEIDSMQRRTKRNRGGTPSNSWGDTWVIPYAEVRLGLGYGVHRTRSKIGEQLLEPERTGMTVEQAQ